MTKSDNFPMKVKGTQATGVLRSNNSQSRLTAHAQHSLLNLTIDRIDWMKYGSINGRRNWGKNWRSRLQKAKGTSEMNNLSSAWWGIKALVCNRLQADSCPAEETREGENVECWGWTSLLPAVGIPNLHTHMANTAVSPLWFTWVPKLRVIDWAANLLNWNWLFIYSNDTSTYQAVVNYW